MSNEGFQYYVARRCLQFVPTFFIVLVISFSMIHLIPGDPILMLVGDTTLATPEYLEMVRAKYGLDKPLFEQLFRYILNILRLDLGYSISYSVPVLDIILEKVPATLLLMGTGMVLGTLVGVFIGVLSARRPFSWIDNVITSISMFLYSVPVFWLGLILILSLSLGLGIFPSGGLMTTGSELKGLDYIFDILMHLFLPAITAGSFQIALTTRIVRAGIIDAMTQNYIITAKAKGVHPNAVIYKHALKNAMLPVVTLVGLSGGHLLTGAILAETVYSWPGMGRLLYDSLFRRDYPTLMGIFLASSLVVMTSQLITDIVYAFFDPRIRLGEKL